MSDQERISPYNIKYRRDDIKEKYQLEDYYLIQYQILLIDIVRIVWQTVGRNANEIFEVKRLIANRWGLYSIFMVRVQHKFGGMRD